MENNYVSLNDGTPTRIKCVNGVMQKTSPDLTFVSQESAIKFEWQVMNESLGSDHMILKIKTEASKCNSHRSKRNFKKADWVKYRTHIERDIKYFPSTLDPQNAYDNFIELVNKAASKSIPTIKLCNNPVRQKCFSPKPYWSPDLSRVVAERRLALAVFRKNPTPQNLQTLQAKIKVAQRCIRNAKYEAWKNFCNEIDGTTSVTQMWNKMRWLKGYRSPRLTPDEEKVTTLLNSLTPDYVIPCKPIFLSENHTLSSPISIHEFNNCIKQTDTAPGADNITYSMLKNLPNTGKLVLCSLYSKFLQLCFIPYQWRNINVVPIPKPGREAGSMSGFRPIALLSCPCKLFHTIITRRLEWFLEKNDCFSCETVGFRKTRSCADGLSRLISRIQMGFTKGISTLGCFVDIDNAYNNIDVVALLSSLDELGVGSIICSYLWEFLHERYLSVQINENKTLCRCTGTGIGQGDPLSPLLFNVATSKICKNITNVFVSQYADDFVLYVSRPNIAESATYIQTALKSFQNMIVQLGLKISYNKTKLCLFSRGNKNTNIMIDINNQNIELVNNIKYLGMWLDRSLKWKRHIDELGDKCSKFLNVFKVLAGSNWGVHPKHMRRLYFTIIRSRIDYCSYLYDNCANSQLCKLDKTQNMCMRIIGGFIKTTPIHVMENELCIPPLFIRRRHLAGKFYLKSRSLKDNPTIDVLRDLSIYQNNAYWRKKKKPLLVHTHLSLGDSDIYSSDILDIFSLNTWLSSIEFNKTISCEIDDANIAKKSTNISILKKKCDNYIDSKYGTSYHLYTDGSKDKDMAGAAFYDPQTNTSVKFRIDCNISIMYCELIAISEALSYALTIDNNRVVILSDSKSALLHLARLPSRYRGSPIAFVIINTIFELHRINKAVVIQWIPSHVGIRGNELADLAAKMALNEGHRYTCLPLQTDLINAVKKSCQEMWQEYFDMRSRVKGIWYKTIQPETPRCPWFQNTDFYRNYIVTLLRLRSGHIPCNKFNYLMGKSNTPYCQDCNIIDDLHHIICECTRNEPQRLQIQTSIAPRFNVGLCNSALADPLSDEAKALCTLYLVRKRDPCTYT